MRLIDADALQDELRQTSTGPDNTIANYCRHVFESILEHAPTIAAEPVINALWHYYLNEEGKARWSCTNCGKICRQDPHDKLRCSSCGAHMTKEA